ncbi:hypothetical protein F5Y09DRAFT_311593 [Xylaria sp. FL1042]|nr:hypothetical protein F5Y09DRAFT_311593 [Xylaria sp. FL1042]
MPKSLGGCASRSGFDGSLIDVTHATSHSDPNVPLVSVFSPTTWHSEQFYFVNPTPRPQDQPPRPRISLQVYYTAPDAGDPACLELAARTLEKKILAERHQGRDPGECDRLDVYGMPPQQLEGKDVVAACVAHQKNEIASRLQDKDWYIQRYDIGGNDWLRALVIVRNGVKEWFGEDGARRPIGLSTVYFDRVCNRSGGGLGGFRQYGADNIGEEWCLIHDLKHELNWQHTAWQFEDWAFSFVSQVF